MSTQQQDDEDTYDALVDSWVSARTATLEQQVAGLRLLHACLDCWLFQYPLTEEPLVEKLGHWAMTGLAPPTQQGSGGQAQQQGSGGQAQQQGSDQAAQQQQQAGSADRVQQQAVLGDGEPSGLTAFLEEAKATYALGE